AFGALGPLRRLGTFRGGLAGGLFLEEATGVFLGPPSLRQVPGDLGEAPKVAGRVVQGRDEDVGPEERPVLAYSPPLGLELPLRGGGLQPPRGLTAANVLRGVEAREMLADDLLRPVPFDALRAGVPGEDIPPRVEHEEG